MRILLLLAFAFFLKTTNAQPLLGRTTGRLPYLNFGLGEDRLGGAKMTFLDSNVLLKVVDSSKGDYKVQLSAQHAAYLPKTAFRRDDSANILPMYLTGSWRVWGDSLADYVSIGLPEKLPYRSLQQVEPSRIVVDIFGAVSNTNWITQLKTVKEIKNVWYEQTEDDVFRVFIELKNKQHWGHAITYRGNALVVKVKRQPEKLKLKHLKIAVDAGHGGAQTGASGLNSKVLEKDYTLKIAKELEAALCKKGVEVVMTRCDDTDIPMANRLQRLNEEAPDLLLSIHLNSAGNKAAKGTSTYYRHIGFRPLSVAVLDRMLELGLHNFGNIGAFNFSLSGPTEYPNCLVEVAFLSNAEDEQRILDPQFHKEVAKKIVKGVEDWLKSMR
ncbi:N-acetylmuramoyl-L-alanine amidase [Flavisolibacter sp. BT320]|nr:N-acetylmuramoyl-L-alanine amidase [Flavisolibacter longurius]